ncbi:18f6c9f8-bfda-4839-949f-d82df02125c5 [Sclerotinia trifoliorum]|uniref:18f6c9f8-bfda-4839-949f-d82df02125c5 n=1 Tax=Sclerotinia trifoliorum TaxID=28548 RepID=A0A8H2VXY5_9HELO|nr:18f6c9f8-bfda-4839-949f-d82df02125c5 [Sclerotinia trifoliorum]
MSKMELDDSWDPDPLPNSRVRNHSQPRFKGQAARDSKMKSQYYQHSQTSYPQHSDRNALINLDDESSDDESSSNGYPFLVQQPQVTRKRMKSPIQHVPDRRKRHQSEHASGTGRDRKTNTEAMHDHYPQVSQPRKKSVLRNDTRYKTPVNNNHNGYLDVENTFPKSRKSDPRRHSRAEDAHQDQFYMEKEDFGEQFVRESSFIAYRGNSFAKRRMKEERVYNSVPPSTFSHEPTSQYHQKSTRANHEPVVTPKTKQRLDYSRAQSVGPRSPYDDGLNLYPGTENGMPSASNRRKRQELQLASPIWQGRECALQEPSSLHRKQGNNEKLTFANSISPAPRNPSVRSRSVALSGTQAVTNQPKKYNYGFIDDDDINETPLEEALQGRPNFQTKIQNTPMNLMKALPKSSAFRRSDSEAAKQIYQSPSRGLNGAVASSITIDLVTPEKAVNLRASMPFIPQHWTPARRGPIKVSNARENFMQDGPGANEVENLTEDVQERQAVTFSTSKVQCPEEIARQRQAAEKIVQKELNADLEALQRDLFGEVVSETEEEKRERDEAKRLQAKRSREAKKKQDAIDANNAKAKRQENELKAQKERDKKGAEQREKNKDVALKKANRDADRNHQSLREAQDAEKRRKDVINKLQTKKEEMAALKVLEEQKQISDRENRERADQMNKIERNLQKLAAQMTAQVAASLKPARKSANENGTTIADTSAPQATIPTSMDVDNEDSLFLPETQITPAEASLDVPLTSQPQIPEAVHSDSNMVPSVEEDQAPASIAEIFAKTIPDTSGGNVLEDREAEREAARKKRLDEHAAAKRKREKSVAADPSTNTATKAAPRTISKPPSKAAAKENEKKCTESLVKSLGSSVFNMQLKPLHGLDAFVPREQPKNINTVSEKDNTETPVLKSCPLPLPPPPPKPTAASIRPETKLISQAEQDEIEASRKKTQSEARARKDALKKQKSDARKDEIYQKKTVEYRRKKEKEFRDKARQDGKELGEFELQTMLDKLMEKRERDKNRRNIRRSGGKPPGEHENDAVSNSSLPNGLGTAAQVSSSDTASEYNHVEEYDDPEAQALKEHEVRTAESLKALAESHAARRSQISPVKELGPLFSDSSSSESEEDPDDEETTQRYIENVRKNAAVTKATNTCNEVETPTVEEVDLEKDFEAAFEEELLIERGTETTAAALNPDGHSAQFVEPMPDMTSYFEESLSQRSSFTLAEQLTQLTIPSQISQPERDEPQKPSSYSMVNVYMVMTQVIFHEHEDEAALKKKFFDVDKANRYAQSLVNEYRTKKYMQQEIVEKWDKEYKYSCQIIHNDHKITKVFVQAIPMNPKDIDKFDPRQINPRFANQYYTVGYEKIIEKLDPETQKVCRIERTTGVIDDNKLYTALEMANHAAAEYLLENIKPEGEVEEHNTLYYEQVLPQVRTGRDDCTNGDEMFHCDLDNEMIPWADFKSFEVKVQSSKTEGPIN